MFFTKKPIMCLFFRTTKKNKLNTLFFFFSRRLVEFKQNKKETKLTRLKHKHTHK